MKWKTNSMKIVDKKQCKTRFTIVIVLQKRCSFADIDSRVFPFKTRNMRPYTLGRE